MKMKKLGIMLIALCMIFSMALEVTAQTAKQGATLDAVKRGVISSRE